jgi:hypothetical protein
MVKIFRLFIYLIPVAGYCIMTNLALAQDSTKQDLSTEKQMQQQNQERNRERHNFVDENGDGYNDNAPDHDGDGIPNVLDPDYRAQKQKGQQEEFVDADGDGINDRLVEKGKEKKMHKKLTAGQKSGQQNQDGTGRQQRKGKNR